jgi:uncharacterized protein YkwD
MRQRQGPIPAPGGAPLSERLPAWAFFVLALALALAAVLSFPARPAAAAECAVSDTSIDFQEQALLDLINSYRAENGAGPLSVSTTLNRAASWMAVDMGSKNYFPADHVDSFGRNPAGRVADCGNAASGIGENMGAGTNRDSGQSQFNGWRNSPGHNTNMLRSEYTHIGVARYYAAGSYYRWYWVALFSRSASDTCPGGCAQAPANGAKFYGIGATEVWLMQNGHKRWIPNVATMNCLPGPVTAYPLHVVQTIPTGPALANLEGCPAPANGAKFYGVGATEVWLMQNGQKRWIPNVATMNCLPGPVVAYPLSTVQSIPTGPALANLEGCPLPAAGTKFYGVGAPEIYLMQNGHKRWIPNIPTLNCLPGAVVAVAMATVQSIPNAAALQDREGCDAAVHGVPPNGTKFFGIGDTRIWLMQNGQKRWIPNVTTLNCLPGPVVAYWNPYVQSIPSGPALLPISGC